MDDPQKLSLILNLVTAILLIVSELLGLSKCEANGIIHLLVKNLQCLTSTAEQIQLESMKEPDRQDQIVVSG